MKTIRQIADEIGVSKTAVNKQIANLGLRSGLRKNGNQFAIDENHEVSDLVCVLQATIDTLQGQLEVKDRQIEKLTEALVAAQQTAAAAQALHAGTIQQQLLTGEAGADQQGQEPEQKRGWFSKLFGK